MTSATDTNLKRVCVSSALLTLMTACGGGGGDAGSPAPPPPAAQACVPSPPPPAPAPGALPPQVTLTVSNGANVNGSIVITLEPTLTPLTVANFLGYVNAGFYNCTVFHRHGRTDALGPFVLQGGGYTAPVTSATRFPAPKTTRAPIALERGLSNLRYTVAMARTGVLNSATSEFFFNTVDNVFLDTAQGGYAAFGTVVTGTTVVNAMVAATCNPSPSNFALSSPDCVPEPNLVITSAAQTR